MDGVEGSLEGIARQVYEANQATQSEIARVAGIVGSLAESVRFLQEDQKRIWDHVAESRDRENELQIQQAGVGRISGGALMGWCGLLLSLITAGAILSNQWGAVSTEAAMWESKHQVLAASLPRKILNEGRLSSLEAKLDILTRRP